MSHVDLILPCYNPSPGWEKSVVARHIEFQDLLGFEVRLILVDDGSTSGTFHSGAEEVKKYLPRTLVVSYPKNRGKGHAVRCGFRASTARYVLFTDIDFPYTAESMVRVVHRLKSDEAPAVVAGRRNANYYSRIPTNRKFVSLTVRRLIISLLGLPVDDTQCGLKGFSEAGKNVVLKSEIERFLFDIEVLLQAALNQLPVVAIDVELHHSARLSNTSVKILFAELINLLRIFRLALSLRRWFAFLKRIRT